MDNDSIYLDEGVIYAHSTRPAAAHFLRVWQERRRAESALHTVWWARRERRAARTALSQLKSSDRLNELATHAADELLLRAFRVQRQRASPHRHVFHREALEAADWEHRVARAARSSPVSAEHVRLWGDIEEVVSSLTPERAKALIEALVKRHASIVDDPHFYVVRSRDPLTGLPAVTVEHAVSGMRAVFEAVDGEFGVIFSKPYEIAPIGPADPSGTSSGALRGLGIGKRLYLAGARQLPLRWQSRILSSEARGARKSLHRLDPFVWEDSTCDWCRARSVRWLGATRSEFSEHPVTEILRSPEPTFWEVGSR